VATLAVENGPGADARHGLGDAPPRFNPLVLAAIAGRAPASLVEVADAYGPVFQAANREWLAGLTEAAEEAAGGGVVTDEDPRHAVVNSPVRRQLRHHLFAPGTPTQVEEPLAAELLNRTVHDTLAGKAGAIEALHLSAAGSPPRAMTLVERADAPPTRVLRRGNPLDRGAEVAARFPAALSAAAPGPFVAGRRRLGLAAALVSPDNPLVRRVIANWAWQHHFGAGLVRTPDDFGTRGRPPTHPELLDWLAEAFRDDGWSLKALHRRIMLTAAYRAAAVEDAAARTLDPDDELLWRAPRRRLDMEAMRDAMLAVSGRLDPAMGGRAVPLSTAPFTGRRTIYGFVNRVQMDPMFGTFDFPSPDMASTERAQTSVPQQALFALNDAFIIEQARALAARALEDAAGVEAGTDGAVTRAMYRRVFQRPPAPEEESLARRLMADAVAAPGDVGRGTWRNGFGSADPTVPREEAFAPLPHFDLQARRYQGAATFPDRDHGFVSVSAGGGHPGDGIAMASVRRWTAPHDGAVAISGEISVGAKGGGDGIRARIISSRAGQLGEWVVDRSNGVSSATLIPKVQVVAGEILDFTVDCRETTTSDGYRWAPVLRSLQMPEQPSGFQKTVWDAQADFVAPPPPRLTPLEQMAQALLMTNEFMFVD
jgi:hypothetical protein